MERKKCKGDCGLVKSLEAFTWIESRGRYEALCRPCRWVYQKKWRSDNPEKTRAMRQRTSRTYRHTLHGQYMAGKWRARNTGREWSILEHEFIRLRAHPCDYCGEPILTTGHGLDRKDSSKGYTVENVVPCCDNCNTFKSDRFTYEEFKEFMRIAKEKNWSCLRVVHVRRKKNAQKGEEGKSTQLQLDQKSAA